MERDGYEKIAYKVLESPKFWFYPDRIKELTGLTYWAEVEQVMRILSDREFITKVRESYEKLGAKYPPETAKVALKNIKAIEEVMKVLPQTVQRVPLTLSAGICLINNFDKSVYKIVALINVPWDPKKRHWYKIRQFDTGVAETIPEDTIPYSYSITECPSREMPKPPSIKVGNSVRWKVKSGYEEGIVKKISDAGEVDIETKKEIMGVKGITSKDIYELENVPGEVPATLHPYAPPARQFEDEMEKLFRSDPAEFYRRKKLVNQAIKERGRGKIKTLPDISLTDLRRIKAHADSLYG